jgi:glycyl-tRNA synthetase
MHPRVWEASGHVTSFYDPKIDCKSCKTRFRADNFITDITRGETNGDALTYEEMERFI